MEVSMGSRHCRQKRRFRAWDVPTRRFLSRLIVPPLSSIG
jgi:hypothetical protein